MTTMTAKGSGKIENIKVLVRVRPPSEAELSHGGYRKAVHATEDGRGCYLTAPGAPQDQGPSKPAFSYDNVVDENTEQERVSRKSVAMKCANVMPKPLELK